MDVQNYGFLNTTEKPVLLGYNATQGIYIRLASGKTYPDMMNYSGGEWNPSGSIYGSFVNNEKTSGTYTVETLNKSSAFEFLNYAVGNTSQPITGMNENYPMSFGINGRATNFEIRWISVSRTPPNYVMPYNFAANESENVSRSAMTFVAEGITDNVQWGIYINNQLFQSSSKSIILYLTNGNYSFYVKDNPSYSIFYNFNGISVSGTNETYYIQLVPETYTLVFNEIGLSGESWYVQLLNGQNFSIPPNDLLYTPHTVGKIFFKKVYCIVKICKVDIPDIWKTIDCNLSARRMKNFIRCSNSEIIGSVNQGYCNVFSRT